MSNNNKICNTKCNRKKDGLVSMLTGGLSQLARQRKIDYVQGRAVLIDSHTVQVTANDGNMRDIQFDYGILATGSRPARLGNLELDHNRVLDSTRALDVRRVPESLLVVGGGYIGLELGSVYAALGATVTVVEMTSTLLPGIDNDLVRIFSRRFDRLVEAVHLNTVVNSLVPDDGGVTVGLSGPDVTASDLRFDEVLVAVGRVPNSNLEGLDNSFNNY